MTRSSPFLIQSFLVRGKWRGAGSRGQNSQRPNVTMAAPARPTIESSPAAATHGDTGTGCQKSSSVHAQGRCSQERPGQGTERPWAAPLVPRPMCSPQGRRRLSTRGLGTSRIGTIDAVVRLYEAALDQFGRCRRDADAAAVVIRRNGECPGNDCENSEHHEQDRSPDVPTTPTSLHGHAARVQAVGQSVGEHLAQLAERRCSPRCDS